MEIHIQVSNIAALIGKHKYRTQKEGIDILASNIYNNKHLKFKTNDSDLIKIKNKLTNDLVKSKNFDKKKSDDIFVEQYLLNIYEKRKIKETSKKIPLEKESEQKTIIENLNKDIEVIKNKEHFETIKNRAIGITKEKDIIKLIKDKLNLDIVYEKNDIIYFSFLTEKGNTIKISGKIDAYDNKEDIIYEIKCRQNRLFKIIPEYEIIQCAYYTFMMKKKSCILIQEYNCEVDKLFTINYEDSEKKVNEYNKELSKFIDSLLDN